MAIACAANAQVSFEANITEGCSPLGVTINVTAPDPLNVPVVWTVTHPDGTIETSNSPAYVAVFTAAGMYDVTLTVDGSESATINDYITVFESPVAAYSIDDPSGCLPHCVQFTDQSAPGGVPIVEWIWDFGNGVVVNDPNPAFCYQLSGTYSPVLSVENASGCFSDYSMPGSVYVSDVFPDVAFVGETSISCNPPTEMAFENTSVGASELQCNWTFGDGYSIGTATAEDVAHVFLNPGVYEVCLAATDAIGCTSDSCQQVEILPQAVASFTASEIQVCAGDSVTFINTTQPLPSAVSWDFDGDGVEDSNAQNPSHAFAVPGNYIVTLDAIYSNDCSDSEFLIIEVLPGLVADFTADSLFSCLTPFPVSFTDNSTVNGNVTYDWLIDGLTVSNGPSLDYTFTDFGAHSVGLSIENEFGCASSYTMPDSILIQEPEVSFSANTVVCSGEVVPIASVNVNSLDPVELWEWDFNGDGVIDDNNEIPSYSYGESGDFSITLDITTANGCLGSATSDQTIAVQEEILYDFTVSDTLICPDMEVQFCLPFQTGINSSWNYGDGSGWDHFNYWDTCVTHNFIDTGWVDINLNLYGGGCNFSGIFDSVLYVMPPIAQYGIERNCIDPLTIVFESTSIEADSLWWDFGDGSPLVFNNPSPTHTFPNEGTFEVALWVYNYATDCSDDMTRNITIQGPNPVINASPDIGCAPLVVNFQEEENQNEYWLVDFGNGTTMEADLVGYNWMVTLSNADSTYTYEETANAWWPSQTFTELGTYDVQVSTIDQYGCAGDTVLTDWVTVTSDPAFSNFSLNFIDDCDQIVVAMVPDVPEFDSWEWSFSTGETTDQIYPTYTFPEPYSEDMWVSLSATDSLGCSSSTTVNLDLDLPPIPSFYPASDPSCQGEEIALINESTGNIVAYSWDFGNPSDGANNFSDAVSPIHSYSANGSFDICLSVENTNGCIQTLCQPSVVNIINPVADFNFEAEINNCLFGVNFENTSVGDIACSEWNFGDQQIGVGMQVFHTYNIGVYDLELVVCNDIGCTDTLLVPDILGYGDVIGQFNLDLDTVACPPFQVGFEAFNINDSEFTYFWDFGDGFGDPQGATITEHTYDTPGTYCPELIMTDPNGCPVLIACEQSIEVIPLALEVPPISPFCTGDSVLVNPTGAETYVWSDVSYVTAAGADQWLLHPTTATTATLTGSYADCEATLNVDIPVLQLPNVALELPVELCHYAEAFELNQGTPAGPTGYYTLDGEPVIGFDPSMSPGQSYEVEYHFTDLNGCYSSAATEVLIHPLPDVNLAALQSLCPNDPVVTLQGGQPLGGVYTVDGVSAATFDPSIGASEYTIGYSLTDNNGCTNADEEVLVVSPLPELDFSLDNACFAGTLEFSNASYVPGDGGIAAVDWDFGVLGNSGDFQPGPIGVISAGAYDVTLSITSMDGCTNELTQSFEINPVPVAAVNAPNGCQGETFALVDASELSAGDLIAWDWDLGALGAYSDIASMELQIDDWGVYDIQLTVTSDQGCTDSVTVPLSVYPLPNPSFDYLGSCAGEAFGFFNSTSIAATEITNYSWDFGDGSPLEVGENTNHIFVGGTYSVSLTAVTEFGCAATDTALIEVAHAPVVNFSSSASTFCAFGETAFLDLTAVPGGEVASWNWYVDGELYGQEDSFVYTSAQPGTVDVLLEVTSDDGCVASLLEEDAVEIYPLPVASFRTSPWDADVFDPRVKFTDFSVDAFEWHYDFGDGEEADVPNLWHTYPDIGSYTAVLTVTNVYGCTDTAQREVVIYPNPTLWIPNAFSPNNDGLNDVWEAGLYGFDLEAFELVLFDRWGGELFRTSDPGFSWDGTFPKRGETVPEGIYNWRVKFLSAHDSSQKVQSGHLTIIR